MIGQKHLGFTDPNLLPTEWDYSSGSLGPSNVYLGSSYDANGNYKGTASSSSNYLAWLLVGGALLGLLYIKSGAAR
jgi:hypothetical protein